MSEEIKECYLKELTRNTGLSKDLCEEYLKKNDYNLEKAFLEIDKDIKIGKIDYGGLIYGNVSNASTLYGMDKFNTLRGHGFAAERANHLYDKITGNDVSIVGDDNIKNGADRIVNGVNIQTKYCNSGSKCVSECFKDGEFRYFNIDGSPMKIEVPFDKYDDAIKAMQNRIKNGQVKGVNDPNEAENIIKKGHFTYEQVKNIAKFGTIESIKFDAVNGVIVATTTMGVSTLITFAVSVWGGEEIDIALKNAAMTGIKIGGITFVTAILSSQLSRAGLNSALVGSSEAIIGLIGPKASAVLVNAFRSGSNIYGAAAMKSAAKLLRTNFITSAVSVIVISSFDVINIFRGRISGKQLFKNIASTTSAVAGGTAGWVGGAAAGAALGSAVPIIGTAIGGVVGGIIGSVAGGVTAGKVSEKVLDNFIEDDADEMVRIIQKTFSDLAFDYLLNKKEAEEIISNLSGELDGKVLKDMFASYDRRGYAKNILVRHIEDRVKKREFISTPTDEEMIRGIKDALESLENDEVVNEEYMERLEGNISTSIIEIDNEII